MGNKHEKDQERWKQTMAAEAAPDLGTGAQDSAQTQMPRSRQKSPHKNSRTKQIGDETTEQKSEICSIENEQDSHTTTMEVIAPPPSFNLSRGQHAWSETRSTRLDRGSRGDGNPQQRPPNLRARRRNSLTMKKPESLWTRRAR
jgi:hypothetical protein